ncbi:MAG: SusD/RagB family nutrient-binding outer membrane lipoprotein [Bacteroidota bacterium]
MKKYLVYMLAAVCLMGTYSCDDQLDVNEDPLAATSADPNSVIPFILTSYEARKQTELGTRILDVSQHLSACFNSPRQGVTTSFLTGNTWGMYYTLMLGNLVLLEADARAAGEAQNNVAALAVILKALAFYEMSVIYEDIPFTQALNGQEFPFPEFDSQETVLKGTVDLLDEAVSLIAQVPSDGAFGIGASDFIYNGNMDLWERYANSLQLRILMIIRNVDAGYADSRIQAVLGRPLLETLDHVASFPFFTDPGAQNAFADLNETFFGTPSNEAVQVYGPGPVLLSLLVDNDDPRTDVFMADLSGTGDFPGPDMGVFPTAVETVISDDVIRFDWPAVWYTPAEVDLYRAELVLEGVISGDADALTQSGVRKALQYYGQEIDGASATISDGDIDAFVSTFTNVDLETVYEQQYLEAFMRPLVSWNHVRRNRWPELDLVPGASISDFLQRFSYPPDEIGANPNTPPQKADNSVTMWAFPAN